MPWHLPAKSGIECTHRGGCSTRRYRPKIIYWYNLFHRSSARISRIVPSQIEFDTCQPTREGIRRFRLKKIKINIYYFLIDRYFFPLSWGVKALNFGWLNWWANKKIRQRMGKLTTCHIFMRWVDDVQKLNKLFENHIFDGNFFPLLFNKIRIKHCLEYRGIQSKVLKIPSLHSKC